MEGKKVVRISGGEVEVEVGSGDGEVDRVQGIRLVALGAWQAGREGSLPLAAVASYPSLVQSCVGWLVSVADTFLPVLKQKSMERKLQPMAAAVVSAVLSQERGETWSSEWNG